jgi:hypothetical protein
MPSTTALMRTQEANPHVSAPLHWLHAIGLRIMVAAAIVSEFALAAAKFGGIEGIGHSLAWFGAGVGWIVLVSKFGSLAVAAVAERDALDLVLVAAAAFAAAVIAVCTCGAAWVTRTGCKRLYPAPRPRVEVHGPPPPSVTMTIVASPIAPAAPPRTLAII